MPRKTIDVPSKDSASTPDSSKSSFTTKIVSKPAFFKSLLSLDKLSSGYEFAKPDARVPRKLGVRSADRRIPSSSPKCP